METAILYEDRNCLVINKPVGLVVNRAESISGETVQDWVEKQSWFSKEDSKVFNDRSGVCHRLDKETSGCLLIAKNAKALSFYLKMFKDRKLTKTYLALVHGKVEPAHGEVVLPLVEKRFSFPGHEQWGNALTLLRLNLKTGRTHQIRVHLSFLGWPIFADDKYLNKKVAVEDRKHLSHHLLHAASLEFETYGGKKVTVEAPMPEDAQRFLDSL